MSSPMPGIAQLIPYGIRLATRVGTALEHTSMRIAGDDAIQAGAFPPIRIRLDFVPALAQRLEHVCGNSPLRTHQARVVGRWEARVREAVAVETRRFHGFLRIEAELDKIQEDLQRPLWNVVATVATEGEHGLTVFQGQSRRGSQARTLARGERCGVARLNFRLRATQTQGHASTGDNGTRLGTLAGRTGKDVAMLVHHPKVRRASRLLPRSPGNSSGFGRRLWSPGQRGAAMARITGRRHSRPGALRVDKLTTLA